MNDALRAEIEAANFESAYPLLLKWCRAFRARHRGEFGLPDEDDLVGRACLLFLDAQRGHDPKRGAYWSRLNRVVTLGLRRDRRDRHVRVRRLREYPTDPRLLRLLRNGPVGGQQEFVADLFEGLSEDARGVVRLIVDPPEGSPFYNASLRPRSWRRVLRNFLLEIGWSWRRVAETFAEISRTMGGS